MGVGRPWGVTLFWVLLCLVVPAAVFRIGMAVVDKVRPRPMRLAPYAYDGHATEAEAARAHRHGRGPGRDHDPGRDQ